MPSQLSNFNQRGQATGMTFLKPCLSANAKATSSTITISENAFLIESGSIQQMQKLAHLQLPFQKMIS
jgi:hypothetical protein